MIETPTHHADVKAMPALVVFFHLLAAFLLHWLLPLPFAFPQILVWAGFALAAAGIGLAFRASRRFTTAGTTLDVHGSVSQIVTGGPYRFSRNPIYLGFVCLAIGFTLIFNTYWGVILSPLLLFSLYKLVIQHEEAYLEKKFKDVYTDYKSRVRRWL
jgi:protein-S-isoprenylcysteine O-methyltransferase Ste14